VHKSILIFSYLPLTFSKKSHKLLHTAFSPPNCGRWGFSGGRGIRRGGGPVGGKCRLPWEFLGWVFPGSATQL